VGAAFGLALSCGVPSSLILIIIPLGPLGLVWACGVAVLYWWCCLLVGAAVGAVAGAIRPGGYGLRWRFSAWAFATVGLVLAQILNGGEFEEQTAVLQLASVAGMVGGGVVGFLVGAWLYLRMRGRLGLRQPFHASLD
jgi:hypothetical protein